MAGRSLFLTMYKGLAFDPFKDLEVFDDGTHIIRQGQITIIKSRKDFNAELTKKKLEGGVTGKDALNSSGLFTEEEIAEMEGLKPKEAETEAQA